MSNNVLKSRYDVVYLFDCKDGNPNGDPDAANAPRLDPQTMQGLVSDVCLKRKIRNYIYLANAKSGEDGKLAAGNGFDLHVQHGTVLNNNIRIACKETKLSTREDEKQEKEKAKNRPREEIGKLQERLCRRFYDIRAFGAVLSTGPNAGQLRGPVQISFARSIDPVLALDFSITRVCGTDEEKATEMGRKAMIPYGLYRCHGFISAHLARETGFNEDDLQLFWQALQQMFDHDRSASHGTMAAQKLVVFKHATALGNAPAHTLFERVTVTRKPAVEVARSFADYDVKLNRDNLPPGIELQELL